MSFVLALMIAATPLKTGSDALLKGDWQKAVDAFTEAIKEKPTAQAYVNRGIAYRRLGQLRAAFDDFNAAIRIDPQEPVGYVNRANLWEQADRPDKAIADLSTALKLKPTASTFAARATVHQKQKKHAKARADYLSALELNENELTALNNLAWMEATCPDDEFRDGETAVRRAFRVCELTKWKVKPYISTLAAAYAEAGEWEKAVRVAQTDERREMFQRREPVRE